MSNVHTLKTSYEVLERTYRKSISDIVQTAISKMSEDDEPEHTAAAIAMAVKHRRLELIDAPSDDDDPDNILPVPQANRDLYSAAPGIEVQVLTDLQKKNGSDGNGSFGWTINCAVYFIDAIDAHHWVKPFALSYAAYIARRPNEGAAA